MNETTRDETRVEVEGTPSLRHPRSILTAIMVLIVVLLAGGMGLRRLHFSSNAAARSISDQRR